MVATKGGETLIDALPLAAQRLDSPLPPELFLSVMALKGADGR